MIIDRADIYLYELPLIKTYRTSFAEIKNKRSIIARLTVGDTVGYGEGATLPFPLYIPDYADSSYAVLRDFLLPLIIGKEIESPEEISMLMKPIKGYSFAKTAIETAFWDVYSQRQNIPLYKLLGGSKSSVSVGGAIGIITDQNKFISSVLQNAELNVPRLKIKIEPGWDIEPIELVKQYCPDMPLLVDANSAYSLEDIDLFRCLDKYDLLMIEQPLAWNDIVDHAELQKQLKTPICLDESILSAEDARRAISIEACKIINIKPGRVGGLTEAKKIHDLCASNGVGVWCGGMMEGSVGRFFNLSVSTLPNYIYPADMSSSSHYFADDIVDTPFASEGGSAQVPNYLSDFGVSQEKLKRYTVESTYLKR